MAQFTPDECIKGCVWYAYCTGHADARARRPADAGLFNDIETEAYQIGFASGDLSLRFNHGRGQFHGHHHYIRAH